MKFFRSLLAKYMLIIISAMFIFQAAFLLITSLFIATSQYEQSDSKFDATNIEKTWRAEASQLPISVQAVESHFKKWVELYPEAGMFWVNHEGKLSLTWQLQSEVPQLWSASDTVFFIQSRYDQDPFTVIAFLGEDREQGFIVFEMSRDMLNQPMGIQIGTRVIVLTILIILLFIAASYMFFRSIRKRLLALQEAMEVRDTDGLPIAIQVKKLDEIGQLELTFNGMITALRDSKDREQAQEQLRRELIANISHDLRTPLTKLRAYTYSLASEQLSSEGQQLVRSMEDLIQRIDQLFDNLLSYTLLMASKLKYEPVNIDMVRFVREAAASWYPAFEKEGFHIEVELNSFKQKLWHVDPIWMGRVLDNLWQNVLRHASSGTYIAIRTISTEAYDAIVIMDRGGGMQRASHETGAGIGLSIVDRMVKGMQLQWKIESDEAGTTISIKRYF